MARFSFYGSLAALATWACGATSTVVRGPDGEQAHSISCEAAPDCYEKATKICDGGYVIRESHGLAQLGANSAPLGDRVEMLVSCKSDLPAETDSAASDREDTHVCQAASNFRKDFGAYWAIKTGGSLLEEPASARDFVVTCQSMAENIQRCLHAPYRRAHEKTCDALLLRLDPPSRNRLDALFLQAPDTPVAPPPRPPGTAL
jgi:hypothetical protein